MVESSEDPVPFVESGTSGGTVGLNSCVSKRPGSSSLSSKLFSAKIEKRQCQKLSCVLRLVPEGDEVADYFHINVDSPLCRFLSPTLPSQWV